MHSEDCQVQPPVVIPNEPQTLPIFFCCLHAKSKYINQGFHMWSSPNKTEREEFIRKAVINRRRITAECARLRRCLNQFSECVCEREKQKRIRKKRRKGVRERENQKKDKKKEEERLSQAYRCTICSALLSRFFFNS